MILTSLSQICLLSLKHQAKKDFVIYLNNMLCFCIYIVFRLWSSTLYLWKYLGLWHRLSWES